MWYNIFLNCSISVIIIILLLNGVVIITFFMMRKSLKRNTSNILLFNQLLADCCVALPLILWALPYFTWRYEYQIFIYSMYVSIGSVLINSLDRFVSLRKPFYHWRLITNYRVTAAVLSVWLISVIPAVSCDTMISNASAQGKYWSYLLSNYTIIVFSIVLVFTLLILILLIFSLLELRTDRHKLSMGASPNYPHKLSEASGIQFHTFDQSNNIQCQPEFYDIQLQEMCESNDIQSHLIRERDDNNLTSPNELSNNYMICGANEMQSQLVSETNKSRDIKCKVKNSKEGRMIKILLAMVFVYALSVLPYVITTIIYHGHYSIGEGLDRSWLFIWITYLLYTLSAIINPLLTICFKQDFNRVMKKYLKRTRKQQEEDIVTVTSIEL